MKQVLVCMSLGIILRKGDPMVAKFYENNPRCRTLHGVWHARSVLIFIALFGWCSNNAHGQNFDNNGIYKGSGLFQVKGAATGLPDTVSGTFEYFGTGLQQIGAKNYEHLLLTGNGSIKKTTSNDVTILKSVAVDKGVRLDVSSTMTLDKPFGRLTESGSVLGHVRKSIDLVHGSNSSDFGGIGLFLSGSSSAAGRTTVTRTTGTPISANGSNSILRYFDLNATVDTLFNTDIKYSFHSSELQGQNPLTLDLWRSTDDGISWRRQRAIRTDSTLTRYNTPNMNMNGRWTAADENNLLGSPKYEWETDSLKIFAGNKQIGRIRKLSDTAFVAQIVDAFNQPVRNESVRFTIAAAPPGAVGQTLTSSLAISDSLGHAETKILFGSAKGDYRIKAFVPGVPTAIDTFTATAKSSIAALIASVPKYADSVKSLITPISITVKDQDSMVVSQTPIAFRLNAPDANYHLTQDTVVTDLSGKASTSVQFGKKSGSVIVNAYAADDPTAHTAIDLTALPGSPAKINNLLGSASRDTVMKVKQFTINLFDSELNPRQGDTVLITWTKPAASTQDSLSAQSVIIDTNNVVTVSARLGEKVGSYKLTATAKNKPELFSSQELSATNDVPAKMFSGTTSFIDTIGAVVPHLATGVNDRYDNAVPFASVQYSVINRPDTLAGGKIDQSILRTDSLGNVTNAFTVGTKSGLYEIQASVNSIREIFKVTANPGMPQKFLAINGFDQTKEILNPLDSLFVVRLMDRANNPIQHDTVYFSVISTPVSSNGAALTRSMAVTDENGIASTLLTLGDKTGIYTVQASSRRTAFTALPEFSAIAVHGGAKMLAYKAGSNQEKQILTSLDTFAVRLKDLGGNPVPGRAVKFAVVDRPNASIGYKLSVDSVLTDSLGEARTVFTLGSKIGRYSVIARSAELSSDSVVKFFATATSGTARTMAQQSGNNQIGQLGDHLRPFIVQVHDIGGNPVPNTRVTFAIVDRPDSLTRDDSLAVQGVVKKDSAVVQTDSSGLASISLVLGNRPGRYSVRASIAGVGDTAFVAKAIFLYADVNHDAYRNIGDLTAMIDHILGRHLLTGYTFIAADLYPHHGDGTNGDGNVDIRDAQACVDSLLRNGWNPTNNWLIQNAGSLSKIESGSSSSGYGSTSFASNTDTCTIQITHIGSRFTLKNTIPIKGLQAAIYLKNNAALDTADIVFPRARMMRADVKSVGKEVTVILWNTQNTPIEPGDSAIFRLPIQLTNNDVDSIHVLISTGENNTVALLNSVQTDIRKNIPHDWMLYQNYPNPFNPSTTIEFDVPEVAGKIPRAAIQIFNILGQHIATLERGIHDAGRYSVVWDGKNENGIRTASGVYFYRLLAGDYVSTKKMVMLK
jgi:hypothetical protein